MKESYRKAWRTTLGPSHVTAVARLHLKRWTGVSVGWVLNPEKVDSGKPTASGSQEGHNESHDIASAARPCSRRKLSERHCRQILTAAALPTTRWDPEEANSCNGSWSLGLISSASRRRARKRVDLSAAFETANLSAASSRLNSSRSINRIAVRSRSESPAIAVRRRSSLSICSYLASGEGALSASASVVSSAIAVTGRKPRRKILVSFIAMVKSQLLNLAGTRN